MKRTPIRKVSKKRSKELREYSKLRKQFLIENPYCQVFMAERNLTKDDVINGVATWSALPEESGEFPGPLKYGRPPLATDIHHKDKRHGKRLNDTKDWLAVCRHYHDLIHYNPSWAREKGYLT